MTCPPHDEAAHPVLSHRQAAVLRALVASYVGEASPVGSETLSHLLPVPIEKLHADPRAFDGKVVTIKGTVTETVSIIVLKYYTLNDGTGEITVLPKGALPQKGSEVTARGTIEEAFNLGGRQVLVFIEEDAGDPSS